MITSWFEHWFDSPLYEALYAHRDSDDAHLLAELIARHASLDRYPRVLDVACGRGRHSLNFAQRGYQVTGVDLAPSAIQKASDQAKNLGLEARFIVGDMREALNDRFDLIVNLFTSFGYFSTDAENEIPLKAMAEMLNPDGQIWIDFLNPGCVRTSIIPDNHGSIPAWNYMIKRWIDDGAVQKEIRLLQSETGDEQIFREYVRLLDLAWFDRVAVKYGLRLVQVFGNYQGDAYIPESSPRMIMQFDRNI
jgi:SAM-dependent methyltransferase